MSRKFLFLAAFVAMFALLPSSVVATNAYVSELITEAQKLGLASSKQWLALGHYNREIGGYESFVDGSHFFLSKEGKRNPAEELEATLRAFAEPALSKPPVDENSNYIQLKDHPQCRFRARYQWLKHELNFDSKRMPEVTCKDFEEWKQAISARSATLIFAGAYVNNPASMFGHTLLRLDKGARGHGSNLTSYAVNYAAEPWTTNPLLYTVLGLTGGFNARFSVLPFYLKAREYSDLESRDLWEYELLLTESELERMVEHIWEIQPHSLDYFYFDENCSFHLLSLIEVARPSLNMMEEFSLFAIPADTLRVALEQKGLVGEKSYRPSKRAEMLASRARLKGEGVDLAAELGSVRSETLLKQISSMPTEKQAAILEAAHSYWIFQGLDKTDSKWGHQLLVERGKIGGRLAELRVEEPSAPDEGHESSRFVLGGGVWSDGLGFASFEWRPSLHDLASDDAGYNPYSQIEFFNTAIEVVLADDPYLRLESFRLLNILSLAPLDSWDLSWSWGIETGLDRLSHSECGVRGCLAYDFLIGFGGTLALGPLTTYLLLDAEAAFSGVFDYYTRIGLGPQLGVLLRLGSLARLLIKAKYRYPLLGESFPSALPRALFDEESAPYSAEATLSLSMTDDIEVRASGSLDRALAEASIGLVLYW